MRFERNKIFILLRSLGSKRKGQRVTQVNRCALNKILVLFRLVCFLPSCVLVIPSYTITPGLSTGFLKLCAAQAQPSGGDTYSPAAYPQAHKSKSRTRFRDSKPGELALYLHTSAIIPPHKPS